MTMSPAPTLRETLAAIAVCAWVLWGEHRFQRRQQREALRRWPLVQPGPFDESRSPWWIGSMIVVGLCILVDCLDAWPQLGALVGALLPGAR